MVLHLCGAVYPDKPPLLFWLVGAVGGATGFSSAFVLRLPSLTATAATAWLVGVLARRCATSRAETMAAAWAPAMFLTSAFVLDKGGRLQIDPLLTFLVTAAAALWCHPRRTRTRVLGAGACVGLAALAKGPVAWVLVGLLVAAEHLTRAGARATRPTGPGTFAGAVALATVPVALWAAAAIHREPGLADHLLWQEHAARLWQASSHPGPLGKQPALLLLYGLPWTPLWLAALARGRAPGLRLWVVMLVVFFMLAAEKRAEYLLPAYPALAVLAARAASSRGFAAMRRLAAGSLAVAAGAAGSLCLGCLHPAVRAALGASGPPALGSNPAPGAPAAITVGPALVGLAGLVAVAAALLAGSAARGAGHRTTWMRKQLLALLVLGTGAAALVLPVVDRAKCAAPLAQTLAARLRGVERVHTLGVRPEAYRFYAALPTVASNAAEIAAAFTASGGRRVAALVEERDLDRVLERLDAATRAALRPEPVGTVGSKTVVLLRRRGTHGPTPAPTLSERPRSRGARTPR